MPTTDRDHNEDAPGRTWYVELFRSPHESDQRAAFEQYFVERDADLVYLDLTPEVTEDGIRVYTAKVDRINEAGVHTSDEEFCLDQNDQPYDRKLPLANVALGEDGNLHVEVVNYLAHRHVLSYLSRRARKDPTTAKRLDAWQDRLRSGLTPTFVKTLHHDDITLYKATTKKNNAHRLVYTIVDDVVYVVAEYVKNDEDRALRVLDKTNFQDFKKTVSK